MTPIVTIILCAVFLQANIQCKDILFCFVCFSAVMLVVLGYHDQKYQVQGSTNVQFGVAIVAALFIPILGAFNSIINRKLKELPDRTITCYTNPS